MIERNNWVKVIESISEGGRAVRGRGSRSVVKASSIISGGCSWGEVERVIRNGEFTAFWEDSGAGNEPLKVLFPKLYQLCNNKEGTIEERVEWSGEGCDWIWSWRRPLFEREFYIFF